MKHLAVRAATPDPWCGQCDVAWTLWELDPFQGTEAGAGIGFPPSNLRAIARFKALRLLESHTNRLGVVVEVRS